MLRRGDCYEVLPSCNQLSDALLPGKKAVMTATIRSRAAQGLCEPRVRLRDGGIRLPCRPDGWGSMAKQLVGRSVQRLTSLDGMRLRLPRGGGIRRLGGRKGGHED